MTTSFLPFLAAISMAILFVAVISLLAYMPYSLVWGDSFTNPIRKHCFVVETKHKRTHGIGLFSAPKLECLPDWDGKIVFEQRECTLIKAKFEGLKLKLKNPSKKYIVCFHY